MRLIIVPGIGGSGEQHWQTHWEAILPDTVRIAPSSWDEPRLEDWMRAIDAVAPTSEDVIVAHSMGCLAVAEWLARHPASAAGVLLVAPPDPTGAQYPTEAAEFGATPPEPLGIPAVAVVSDDDPYTTPARSQEYARAWRAELVGVGRLGHINSASDLRDWPQGRAILDDLVVRAVA